MRLTLHTDYALRTLMLLALDPSRVYTIEEVSRRYGISRNHLMKVARTLVQSGFVHGMRGRGGGLRLLRDPAEVSLGAVVRATEDGFALVDCFDAERSSCAIRPACGLRRPLQEALEAFLAVLDRYSLADLVGSPVMVTRMRLLLDDAAVAARHPTRRPPPGARI
jgi:Rrf2 family nitric oxide-sensitive transcriptional repressor